MKQGFTLIEIMVAVSIFAIVAVITTGALVTASDVNRKAQAIKIAMDNVSFAMDSMVFNLRDGANFGCFTDQRDFNGAKSQLGIGCIKGIGIVFESKRPSNAGDIVVYRFKEGSAGNPGKIQFTSSDAPSDDVDITSPEVDITGLSFYIPIAEVSPITPRATIVVRGEVPGKNPTEFNLQTTVKANF